MVNISVMEDPGLPVGMSYEWLNPQGTQLKLVWMPRSTQYGKIHELVVTGKQVRDRPSRGAYGVQRPRMMVSKGFVPCKCSGRVSVLRNCG